MTTAPRPNHRPSYTQRESYREALADAYSEGRLDDAEFSTRSSGIDTAKLLKDLEALVADVPRDSIPRPLQPQQRFAATPVPHRAFSRVLTTVLAVVALGLGALVGSAGHGSAAEDSSYSAKSPDLNTAADRGYLSYGYIKGVLDALGDKRVKEIDLGWTGATAEVIQPGGKRAHPVKFDQDFNQTDDSGPDDELNADEANLVSFSATDVDPAVVFAAVKQAPELVAKRAGGAKPETLLSSSVRLERSESTPVIGQKKRALVMNILVQGRNADSDSNAMSGFVDWSGDGKQLLGVRVS